MPKETQIVKSRNSKTLLTPFLTKDENEWLVKAKGWALSHNGSLVLKKVAMSKEYNSQKISFFLLKFILKESQKV